MDFKKEIEESLESLKELGIDRATAEAELGYSPNYIDQALSKGGNRKFSKVLKNYLINVLQKASKDLKSVDVVESAPALQKETFETLLSNLMRQQNQLLEKQNSILEHQNAVVLEKISALGTKTEMEDLFERYFNKKDKKTEEELTFNSVEPVVASSSLRGSKTDAPEFSESVGKTGKRSEGKSGKQKGSAGGSRK